MSAQEKLIAALSAYPALKFARLKNRLVIEASSPSGFPVSVTEADGKSIVYLGNCRWIFRNDDEAVQHVLFGLSDRCRLREYLRGKAYRWVVEQKAEDGWSPMNETRLLFFRFWKRREVKIYRNEVVAW